MWHRIYIAIGQPAHRGALTDDDFERWPRGSNPAEKAGRQSASGGFEMAYSLIHLLHSAGFFYKFNLYILMPT